MKIITYLLPIIFFPLVINAQSGIGNHGAVKLHDQGQVGLHDHLYNGGHWDGESSSKTGLYHDHGFTIKGNTVNFGDVEVFVGDAIHVDTSMDIKNMLSLMDGDLYTDKLLGDSNWINLSPSGNHNGGTNGSHINGVLQKEQTMDFLFPLGEGQIQKPIRVQLEKAPSDVKCSYNIIFSDTPTLLGFGYIPLAFKEEELKVSDREFWNLEAEGMGKVTLPYDAISNLENTSDIRIVGWHIQTGIWDDIGGNDILGDELEGTITSDVVNLSNYAAVTLATLLEAEEEEEPEEAVEFTTDNYKMSANGDGINDFLDFEGLDQFSSNDLKIFNRWGTLVFEMEDYDGEFIGYSNRKNAINKSAMLPAGIYYYILEVHDLGKKFQGFLYLGTD